MEDDSETLYRRPQGYWAVFNKWWRETFAATSRRPDFPSIERWWNENAATVWPDPACRPDVHDTRTHAKCMRTVETVREYFKQYRQLHRDKRPWQSRAVYVDKLPPKVLEAKRARRAKRGLRVGHNDSDSNADATEGHLISTAAQSTTAITHQHHMQRPAVQLTYPPTIANDNDNTKPAVCNAFGLLLPGPQPIINNLQTSSHSTTMYTGYRLSQTNLQGRRSMQATPVDLTMQFPWTLSVPRPSINSSRMPAQAEFPGHALQDIQQNMQTHAQQAQQFAGNMACLGNGQMRQPMSSANTLQALEQGVDTAIAAELQASNELLKASGMSVFSLAAAVQTAQHMTDMAFNLYACQAEQQGLAWNIIKPSHPMWPVYEIRVAVSAQQTAGFNNNTTATMAITEADVSQLVIEATTKTAAFVQRSISGMTATLHGQQLQQQWQPRNSLPFGLDPLHGCASIAAGFEMGPSNSANLPVSSNNPTLSGFKQLSVDQLILNSADTDSPSHVIAKIAEFENFKNSPAPLPVQAMPFQAFQIQNLVTDVHRADADQQASENVAANPETGCTETQACSSSVAADAFSQYRLLQASDYNPFDTNLRVQHGTHTAQNLLQHTGLLLPQPWHQQQQQQDCDGATSLSMHFSWPLTMSSNTQTTSASSQQSDIQQPNDNQRLFVADGAPAIGQLGRRLQSVPENVLLQYSRFHPANHAQVNAQATLSTGLLQELPSQIEYENSHMQGATTQNLKAKQHNTQSAPQLGLQYPDLLASLNLSALQANQAV